MHKIKYILCLAVVSHIIISAICAYALEIEDNLSSGYKAYKNGNFETAIAHLESAKGDDSILSDFALYYLGEAHLSISNLDEALNSFLNFVDYHTKSPLTPYAMEKVGDVYLAKGQTVSSINAYKKFLEKYQSSTQTPDVIYKLISILFSIDKYEEAAPFVKRLLVEFPQAEFNDDSFASQILSNEIRKFSTDEFAIRTKGLLKAGRHKRASTEIKEYLFEGLPWFPAEKPSERHDKLLLILGQSLYQARDYKKANEVFEDIFLYTDDKKIQAESLIWIARTYIRLKDFESAKDILNALLSDYPDTNFRDEAAYRLAMIAKDEEDTKLSIALFQQLIKENPASTYKNDALWQIGWLYYSQKNLEESLNTLKILENSPLKMRALYWQGKILKMLGDEDRAVRLLKAAADNFPPTYYSTLAGKTLNPEVSGLKTISRTDILPVALSGDNGQIEQDEKKESIPVKRARKLLELGFNDLALKELASMDKQENPMIVSLLYREAGEVYRSFVIARDRLGYSNQSYQLVFPEGYKEIVEKSAKEFGIDPLLVYAIMMQESQFDAKSVSWAGAIGLLQIMPSTGKMLARELSFSPFKEDDLFEVSTNISFGAQYLKMLITKFKGNLPLALASYNAGPNAVEEWRKRWNLTDIDEFVENIPYPETRKYVEKVLGYYEAYKAIYASTPTQAYMLDQTIKNYD
ncbi:MAG TPA: hypothetical protein DCL42_12360 [Deltaproteobacteria bacterium]|nr:MAG: hypothetical protein A2090_07480 [Deltaproteobacteria bacterium GWD2_42_10]HAG52112.1 hypothetical protein [Deltaproteobacteria bacterium]